MTLTYPASTGRNFDELLRVIDSLQLTDKHKVATPVDWKHGDDVIIVPAVSDEDAHKLFPAGFDAKKPYLRWSPTPRPSRAAPEPHRAEAAPWCPSWARPAPGGAGHHLPGHAPAGTGW